MQRGRRRSKRILIHAIVNAMKNNLIDLNITSDITLQKA